MAYMVEVYISDMDKLDVRDGAPFPKHVKYFKKLIDPEQYPALELNDLTVEILDELKYDARRQQEEAANAG